MRLETQNWMVLFPATGHIFLYSILADWCMGQSIQVKYVEDSL